MAKLPKHDPIAHRPNPSTPLSSDLTFLTNEAGNTLHDRFTVLLKKDTRYFDCLVGYFFVGGFYKLYPALEAVEKIRILIGLNTDEAAYNLMEQAKEQGKLSFVSHAVAKECVASEVLHELERAPDALDVETGVHKFVEWIRSGKLEIKASSEMMLGSILKSKPVRQCRGSLGLIDG